MANGVNHTVDAAHFMVAAARHTLHVRSVPTDPRSVAFLLVAMFSIAFFFQVVG
jgi:hypothetical protein